MPTETSANPPDTAPLGLLEQVGMLGAGGVTSRELVEDALRRTEAAQADLNAFRVIRAEEALAEADAADRRIAAGEGAPLLGRADRDQGRRRPRRAPDPVRLRRLPLARRAATPRWCGGCARRARS